MPHGGVGVSAIDDIDDSSAVVGTTAFQTSASATSVAQFLKVNNIT